MKKILTYSLCILVFACSPEKPESDKKQETSKTTQPTLRLTFNPDSAYQYVKQQTVFGPRVPNTNAHTACKNWLVSQFKKFGLKVQEQSFEKRAYDGQSLKLTNIIAEYKPEKKKRVIIAAHWDTRHMADNDTVNQNTPIEGANDGASGVGIALELARVIAQSDLNIGVDFVLFDGEDYGQPDNSNHPVMNDSWCLGSQYWANNKHRSNYYPDYGILLDMVGAKGAKFSKEGVSRYYAKNIVEKIWRTAHQSGYSDYFMYRNADQIVDDHTYINQIAQIPMVDIIEHKPFSANGTYFGDYHHTHADNMEIIDKGTLKAVGQTVLNVLVKE